MGATKLEAFRLKDQQLARYAKALGHPARVAILRLLLQKQSCVCGDLVEELPLSQSTVSQHLKELKEAGLIQGEIEGPRVCYCIDATAWKRAEQFFQTFFETKPHQQKQCC
ncbi:MAG TPA: metalloregulator ArsR/SmtB family transcription factor [Lacibacter sp.]|nr:metalloregulator ArsR/SmtB family transcription factor [Lacibacter sp.]HMO87863.1 metalloregulator ArsR/SmtB family transcription factor [Lacibacter sp.]HMP85952.1 metalloregulator ArsR/SmtB family transcription factor [Lacibacter sp.]